MVTKSIIGRNGEEFALKKLEKQGYKILYRNYRAGKKEIDIIALENNILCFIEVKNYLYNSLKPLYNAINQQKRWYLVAAATHFLATHQNYERYISRFDAVLTKHTANGEIIEFELIKDFFRP